MAEGLEEESKKSLQMEAELEKQIAQFDTESQVLRANLHREEKRYSVLATILPLPSHHTTLLRSITDRRPQLFKNKLASFYLIHSAQMRLDFESRLASF